MSTEQTKQGGECSDPPQKDECADCDTKLIDQLKCEAEGVAAEAAYNAEYQGEVTAAQVKFNEIRNKYRATRTEVTADVHDMHHHTKRLIDRIKCLINQKRVVECLDEAWCEVKETLTCCPKDGGCCVDPAECVFPIPDENTCEGEWETELKALITTYSEHAATAKACFETLSGEPDALAQRVRDRKAEPDEIMAKLGGDDAARDLKRLYASAVVLKYRLANIWNGFKETKDFVDCLCQALTCWTKGSAAVAVLKNKLAVLQCKKKAETDRCTYIKEHTVDEILTEYEKKCCPDPCAPDDDCHDDDHDDCECGCGSEKPGSTAD
jgi:hypothetical protein